MPAPDHDRAVSLDARPGLAPALVVGLIVLVAPWTGGAMSSLTTGLFALLGAGLLATLAADPACLARGRSPALRWIGISVAGLVGLGALQLLPLGPLLGLLSPASESLRAPFAPSGSDPLGCVALYPGNARPALLGLALAAAIFLACARALPSRAPRLLVQAIVIAGALQALFAWGAFVEAGAFRFPRAQGAYLSPNHFGLMLALCLPPALAFSGLYTSERVAPRQKVTWGLVAATLALGIVTSRSRSAVVAAVCVILAQAWLSRDARLKSRGVLVTLGALGLGVATAGWHALGFRFGQALEGQESLRISFWVGGLEIWTKFPLLGAGLRSHDEITPSLVDLGLLVNAAHNDYVNLVSDLGLVGLGLVTLGLAAFVRLVRRGLARSGPRKIRGDERRLGAALLASMVGVAAVSVFEFNLQIRANLWLIAAIAGLAIAVLAPPPARPVSPAGHAWAKRLGWALLAAALVLGAAGARLALASYSLDQGRKTELPERERLEWLERARRLAPANAEPDAEQGRIHLLAGRASAAETSFWRAAHKRPRWADYHVDLARGAYGAKHLKRGDEALERAALLAPHFPIARFEAARLWAWRAQSKQAPPRAREACTEALSDVIRKSQAQSVDSTLLLLVSLPSPTPEEAARVFEHATPALRRRAARWLGYVGRDHIHRHLAAELGRAVLAPLIGPEANDDDLILEGSLHVLRGKPTPAIEVWLKAYEQARDPAKVLAQACRLLEDKGLEPLALILCERAGERRPDVAAAWLEVGLRLRRRKSVIGATRALERAATLDPLAAGMALGDCYAQQGLEQSAQTAYRRALNKAVAPGHRTALRVRIGSSLLREGKHREAQAEAEAALRLDPEHAGAKALLTRARSAPRRKP